MKYSDDLIGNMDETPLCINMVPNYSISQKRKKSFIIHTQSEDNCRFSIILTIIGNGNKLPPLMIFKGEPNNKIIKEINNNIYVKTNKIFLKYNSNPWCTKDIILKWYNKI